MRKRLINKWKTNTSVKKYKIDKQVQNRQTISIHAK